MSEQKKKVLVLAAIAGVALGATTFHANAVDKEVHCFGVNNCKGQNDCKVFKGQIEAANKEFKDKYKASAEHECGAKGSCGAESGMLNYKKMSEADCKAKKGFLIEGKDEKAMIKQPA